LCEAIRQAFDASGHSDWVISIATSVNKNMLELGYSMVELAKHIDWFSFMSYDIKGPWDSVAGSHTDMQYITNTTNYILDLGVAPEKIVFGLAAYGRSTKLLNRYCTTDGCPIGGAGEFTYPMLQLFINRFYFKLFVV
jgi:chitinase